MSYINADVSNAVNPYLTDVGVGLVFGLGYYLIKYIYGEKDSKDNKIVKTVDGKVCWDSAESIDQYNHLIKQNEEDVKLNPFEILDLIQKKHLIPDINTYNNLLNACYCSNNLESASKLVEEIFGFGSPVQPDLSTFNILLKGISCKLDQLTDNNEKKKMVVLMDKVYEDIEKYSQSNSNNNQIKPNDITINTSLDILIKAGETKRAWDLFDNMQTIYKVEPDKYSYSTIIKALKYEMDGSKLEKAFGILEYLKNRTNTGNNDEIIFNCLIDVCIKLNLIEKAEKVFNEMKNIKIEPSKITYAIMIKGYGQVYALDKAFEIFEEMKENHLQPNEIIYGCLLNACVRCSNIEKLTQVYKEMKEYNLDMNIVLYTTLIKAYTKVKNLDIALDVYHTMLNDKNVKPNIVIHNAMLDCCVECNNINKLQEIYKNIKCALSDNNEEEDSPQPDLITYSTVIKGHARSGQMDEVFNIYKYLIANPNQYTLDEVIYNSILDGCVKTKNYDKAIEIYNDMMDRKVNKSNVTYSILIKLYSNNSDSFKALSLLEEMQSNGIKPGIIVYTCLIQTCLKSKKFDMAVKLFEQMKSNGLKPDHVLYNTIINGCIYNEKWDQGCKYCLESFNFNVKIADNIYKTLLNKLTKNYCKLNIKAKCDYATKILKELKCRGLDLEYETLTKITKMIYQTNGVNVDFSYEEKNYRPEYHTYNKKDSNKDDLKWQRKYNK